LINSEQLLAIGPDYTRSLQVRPGDLSLNLRFLLVLGTLVLWKYHQGGTRWGDRRLGYSAYGESLTRLRLNDGRFCCQM